MMEMLQVHDSTYKKLVFCLYIGSITDHCADIVVQFYTFEDLKSTSSLNLLSQKLHGNAMATASETYSEKK